MPVITAIRRQQKRTDRYAVYVDKQYRFSLPDLELSASGLRVGDELTEAEIAAMQRQAGESKAYDMALRFLSVRVRSVREVRDYLVRKGSDPDEAAVIVQRLETTGWLDDQAFAEAWVAERQVLRPRSRRALEQELLAKGVGREVAHQAVMAIGAAAHDQMLDELVAKKRRQASYQDDSKLMAYLARQGFEYDQIKKALARLDD